MPLRSTAMQRSQSSGLMSSTLAVGPAMPALLTSTSSPRRYFSTSANRRSTSSSFATSASVCVTVGSCFFVLARAFSSTSQICTFAPWSTNVRAITRPMPPAPAVTRTRSPLAENSIAPHNTRTFAGERRGRKRTPANDDLDRAGRAQGHFAHRRGNPLAAAHPRPAVSRVRRRARRCRSRRRDLSGPFLLRGARHELSLCELLQARDALEDRDRGARHDRLHHLGAVVQRAPGEPARQPVPAAG